MMKDDRKNPTPCQPLRAPQLTTAIRTKGTAPLTRVLPARRLVHAVHVRPVWMATGWGMRHQCFGSANLSSTHCSQLAVRLAPQSMVFTVHESIVRSRSRNSTQPLSVQLPSPSQDIPLTKVPILQNTAKGPLSATKLWMLPLARVVISRNWRCGYLEPFVFLVVRLPEGCVIQRVPVESFQSLSCLLVRHFVGHKVEELL